MSITLFAALLSACGSRSGLYDLEADPTSTTTMSDAGPPDASGPCAPGEAQSCYSGPSGTAGVGPCLAGTQICLQDGSGFGPCEGEVTPAFDSCTTEADENCDGAGGVTCDLDQYWSRSLDFAGGTAVVSDPAGNVLVGGLCQEADFVGLPKEMGSLCLTKFTSLGEVMWGRRYNAKLLALATDKEGNVWLGGGFEGTVDFGGGPFENAKLNDDMFLAKLDPEGNHLWSKQIGDEGGGQSGQIATSIATLPDGSAIVAGELDGTADFGAGLVAADVGSDVFILKVSPTGLLVWQQVFSGEKWQRPKTVAVLPGGDIAVSGLFWSEIVCGDTWLTKDEQTGAFFARLDAEGEVIACSSVSPTMSADAAALAPQADGGLWVAGVFKGDVTLGAEDFTSGNDFDSFVARVDEKLSVTQAFTLTGPAAQLLWAGAAHPAGHFYLGGELTDDLQVQGETLTPAEGMKDAGFILRIAPDGTLEWAKRYGEGKRAVVTSVALDPSGNLLAVGDFQLGAISFGDKNSPHQTSGFAMFVAKMPP